jgi:hypothetical protein
MLVALSFAGITGSGAGCAKVAPAELGGPTGSMAEGDAQSGSSDSGGTAAPTVPTYIGLSIFSVPCSSPPPSVDWSPLRRISRVEYDNMVHDLLGDTTAPATAFVSESPYEFGVNFQANTYTSVSELIVQQYVQSAETLAQTAVSSANTLSGILGCTTQDQTCAQQFIATWANRAFRGQLDDATSASLLQLYSDVASQTDFTTGIQAVITAVLESPRFLYVLEFGNGSPTGKVVALSPYEVAGRLALFLWRSVPDANLMQMAAAGQLATADAVRAQAQAMMKDPKALEALNDFTTQWMQLELTSGLDKDAQFTTWSHLGKIGEELKDETLTDYSQAVLGGETLTDVLTTPQSYLKPDLASFYDVGMGGGTAVTVDDTALAQGQTSFAPTTMPNRAGILTNGGVLATQSHTTLPSAVLRGKLVREQVLCDLIPAPPPNVPAPPTSPPDGGTFRQQFEEQHNLPGCIGCHQYMDPIGWGFGNFDATGAYQATDSNGFPGTFPPIDSTGSVYAMNPGAFGSGIDGGAAFNGAVDLATQLANATQTQECFALQQFRYALSRMETMSDACSVQRAYSTFSAGTLNIQSLMIAITGTDAFLYRSVENAGGSCQ